MAITYTWTVKDMSVLQSPSENFVVSAHWMCSGTDGTRTAEIDGFVKFTEVSSATFVAYASLTQSVVLGWVNVELGTNGITSAQSCVEGQINSMITPPVAPAAAAVPW